MVYVIMSPAVGQARTSVPWRVRGAAYLLAATGAGASVGALLGLAGSSLGDTARAGLATVLAVGAIAIVAWELLGGRLRIPQAERETPRRWLQHHAILAAAVNGAALGTGVLTRIGFWLWFAVPAGALLLGDVVLSAALFGTYSITRTGSTFAILAVARAGRQDSPGADKLGLGLLTFREPARWVTASMLTVLGVMGIIAIEA